MKFIIECNDGSIYIHNDESMGGDHGACLADKSSQLEKSGFLICENDGEYISAFKNVVKTIRIK